MAEIIQEEPTGPALSRWAIAALVVLLILAAIYALSTSSKTYVTPMDSQSLPKAPEILERTQSSQQLQTRSSQNQPVSSGQPSQLQTGSSSVQSASPNSPQHAGASNPSDLMYMTP